MAVLAHALQVVGGWIPPLVIFFVKRQSRFVSFHALQVLFLELVYLVITMSVVMFWIAIIALTVINNHGSKQRLPGRDLRCFSYILACFHGRLGHKDRGRCGLFD